MSESKTQRSVLGKAVETALTPLHAATSEPAQRAYLGTFLFAFASISLLCISSIAFILFYNSYVPEIGVERTVHLQFGNGHPYGTASLSSSLTSYQPYDISLYLHLPRTPANLATGNFMVDLALISPRTPSSSPADLLSSFDFARSSDTVLGRSRRPGILTYTSSIVDTAHKLASLPLFVTGWRKESEVVRISMFENVEFEKGWPNIPDRVHVVVEADEKMQFYEVEVKIRARFRGLRWILYNHRISSFLFFTTAFFSVSMTTASLIYLMFTFYTSNKVKPEQGPEVKEEPQDPKGAFNPLSTSELSDTSRTFPTRGRQLPLHFPSRAEGRRLEEEEARIKEEEEIERTTDIQPLGGEADDEDEETGGTGSAWRDSGIGTGIEEGDGRGVQRRRRSSHGS